MAPSLAMRRETRTQSCSDRLEIVGGRARLQTRSHKVDEGAAVGPVCRQLRRRALRDREQGAHRVHVRQWRRPRGQLQKEMSLLAAVYLLAAAIYILACQKIKIYQAQPSARAQN